MTDNQQKKGDVIQLLNDLVDRRWEGLCFSTKGGWRPINVECNKQRGDVEDVLYSR